MISEMPTEEPRFRISVQSAAPSVRKSPGSVAKATVFKRHENEAQPDALDDAVDRDRAARRCRETSRP